MTQDKTLKRRVRTRMAKTGESYTTARRQITQKRDREKAARARLAATADLPSDDSVRKATGKGWDEWLSILDGWGAREKRHGEVAQYLGEQHGVPGWWAQSVTVAYERARGGRLKHQRKGGFAISASRTINAPVDEVFAAFTGTRERKRWLTEGTLSLRTAQPNRSARFDWDDGTTRVNVGFEEKTSGKTVVSVEHERLADADDAETTKAAWKERLARLKSLLEER